MALTPADFVARWKRNTLTERSASQSQFIDLCELLGETHPAAADAVGERYTFEKAVPKTSGGKGFADVWLRDHFAWEYKGKHKDPAKAYKQINDYREELGNPPLLVVSDMERFEVHTNFTSTRKRVYVFTLDDLLRNKPTATCPLAPFEVLHALFGNTNALRPDRTDAFVTQEAAKVFSRLAERLEIEKRALTDAPINSREEIAHFLMRLLFCLFADSIGLLPNHLFRRLIQSDDRFLPKRFLRKLKLLFAAMSERDSIFGEHSIKYFNGGLFDSDAIIELDTADLGILYEVSLNYDWSHVAPEIFGTLFERSLNKERRSLIGAHFTCAEDILLLIEPVLMRPLECRWAEVKAQLLAALDTERRQVEQNSSRQARLRTAYSDSERLLAAWIDELTAVRVLDPACGSGNFLYLALRRMLDLWLEARSFAAEQGISLVLPKMVSPSQLFGIESEFYAHELASVVVWIGFLQWKHEHGILEDREPILQKLANIEHADAILRYDSEGNPYEPFWPPADFIIGNPPFLGSQDMRGELGDIYVDDLRRLYSGRVPGSADLVLFWFERARQLIANKEARRAGLIGTQAIRGGQNRTVLERIKQSGDIFWAISDRKWPTPEKKSGLKKAMVRVSMVGFDSCSEKHRELDGVRVETIHANLRSGLDSTRATRLRENRRLAFQGPVKVGKFEISRSTTLKMLSSPNPNGVANLEVIKPWMNGNDLKLRPKGRYIIDFESKTFEEAALFELPFEHLKRVVMPTRAKNKDQKRRDFWWRLGRSGSELKRAKAHLQRIAITTRHSKHRIFLWAPQDLVPDSALIAVSRDDDYFFGVLHSLVHELWARAQGTQLREVESGFRYTPNSTFDTFPFPWPPGTEPTEADSPIVCAIADAARDLVHLRNNWLDPKDTAGEPLPEADLKKRTLTNLYSARPQWLANAHLILDRAVFAAYGWPEDPATLPKEDILFRLLALNHERAATEQTSAPKSAQLRSRSSA